MQRIVAVTGASGFVGREVVRALVARGYGVIALGRDPSEAGFPAGVEVRRFDPGAAEATPQAFEGADAVVHLAGETVDGRWTAEKKRRIASSRVDGTRNLVRSLAACARKPAVLVSASAVGYYGSRGDEPLFESSSPGDDFLAGVCAEWERATEEATTLGIRTAYLRTGVVLGDGGALAKMKAPFLVGAGGPLGSGAQLFPWIHAHDLAALYCFVLERDDVRGPVNAVAPDYATNARFAQALGAALGRPALIPAPAFALRALLGEFADTILTSQLVIPAVAQDHGFEWAHGQLEQALVDILKPGGKAHVRTFRATQFVPGSIDRIFSFFSDARNLEKITPPLLGFKIRSAPPVVERGSLIEYALKVRGIPMAWKTLIAEFVPGKRFVDVQLHGPYAYWHHTHEFRQVDGGVEISDAVDYVLPFAPFDALVAGLVERDVAQIFAYRKRFIENEFGPAPHAAKAGPPPLRAVR